MSAHLQLTYLLYGAAFFAMGTVVLARVIPVRARKISGSFVWMGWYGLFQSLSQWSLLPAVQTTISDSAYPTLIFAALSYCSLIQFASTLAGGPFSARPRLRTMVAVFSLVTACGSFLLEAAAQTELLLNMLLGVPASVFAAFALFRNRTLFAEPTRKLHWPKLAAAGLLVHGAVIAVSPTGDGLQGLTFLQAELEAVSGFSMQAASAFVAILVATSICMSLEGKDPIGHRLLSQEAGERFRSVEQSEEKFRKLFEHAGIGMMLIDGNGTVLSANQSLENLLGYPQGSLVGSSLFDLTHPDDHDISRRMLALWSGHGSDTVRFQKRYFTKTGATIWAQVTVSTIGPDENNRRTAVSQVEDITERKRGELALKQSEARFRELLENSPMGVAVVRHKTVAGAVVAERLFANEALANMFGFGSLEILIGNDISESWIDQNALQYANRTMLDGKHLIDFEARRRRVDGEEFWVSMNSRPIRFDGKPCTVIWHFDITERKHAEIALKQSQDRLIEAQRIAKIGSWDFDFLSGELNWSDEVYRIFETKPDATPKSLNAFLELVHPDDRESVNAAYQNALTKGTTYGTAHRLRMKDGRVKWVHERCETEYDANEKPLRSRGTVQDITEQRVAEARIVELNENLERRVEERTRELEDAQAELVRNERLATLGRLSATVSHELRNPLGTIRASLFSLRQTARENNTDVEQAAARIERSIDRCGLIIDEMLVYARARPPEPLSTNVEEWLDGVMRDQTLPRNIRLDIFHDSSAATVDFDPESMRRAVVNLIENACHALNEQNDERLKTLTIRTKRSGESFEISISDNGAGIEPQVLENVFEPLYSTKSFGIGLGLPIVRQIAESHGGTFELISDPGQGTRATLRIPAYANVVPMSAAD